MLLKIRDDVDLKELEKFGFIKYRSIEDGEMYYCIYNLFIGKDRRILQEDGINPCKSVDYQLSEIEIGIIYDLIQARISRKGVIMKLIKKLKQKRCSNCKYNFKTEHLNCCERPDKNGLKILKPLKLICFRKKKGVEYERYRS